MDRATDILGTLALYTAKGVGFLALVAAIIFAFGLVGCFLSNSESAPRWATISGGVIFFGGLSLLIGWWLSV